MSLSSKLLHVFQAGLRVESRFGVLRRTQNVDRLRFVCYSNRNLSSSLSYFKRLYSTNPKPSETKNEESVSSASQPASLEHANDVKNDQKKVNEIKSQNGELTDLLKKLDEQVKLVGRLDVEQIQELLNRCKKGISSMEAAMLVRCTGNLLVKESLEERQKIMARVWKKVEACCPLITTEVTNALMSVKLENKIPFEPTEVLAKLEQDKNVPSKKTYELLIAQFCEVGDVQGANEVVSHLKSLDWPVSMSSIHSLIRGYTKIGDFDEAKNVIETMNKHGHRPTADTYTSLMHGYAEKGDLDGIRGVMTTVANKNIRIPLRNAYDIVLTLSMSGHEDKVSEAMDALVSSRLHDMRSIRMSQGQMMGQRRFDYQDSMNLIFQLMAENRPGVIKHVLRNVLGNAILSEEAASNFCMKCIISELIREGKPASEVMKVREMLVKEKFLKSDLEDVAVWGMRLQKPDYILELFTELKNLGMEFKPHYTWPVFSKAKQNKNAEEIYRITSFLVDSSTSIFSASQTIVKWSFDNLRQLGHDPQTILSKYKEHGVPANMRDMIEVAYLTGEGKFGNVQQLIEDEHQFSIRLILSNVEEGIKKANLETKELVSLIKLLDEKLKMNLKYNSQFLISGIYSMNDPKKLDEFLQNWVDSELKYFERMSYTVREGISRRGASKHLIEKVLSLASTASLAYRYDSPLSKVGGSETLRVDGTADAPVAEGTAAGAPVTEGAVARAPVAVKKGIRVIRTKEENVTSAAEVQEGPAVAEVRGLLQKKELKEVKTLVYKMAEAGDVDGVTSMKVLRIPKFLKSFFNRCLFLANIESNKAKEYIEKTPTEELMASLSLNIFIKLEEKEPSVFEQIEEILKKPQNEESFQLVPLNSLYGYYMKKDQVDKAEHLFECHPTLKNKVQLKSVCGQAKFDKNEGILRHVIRIHKDSEHPWRTGIAYNQLLLLKCESNDHKAAMDVYTEALANGMTFESFGVRGLQAFQSVLQGNQQALPWKEGEVEKKAELAAQRRANLSSSDSDNE